MNKPARPENLSLTLVRVIAVSPAKYSLEAAAQLAGVHPELLRYYCQVGLLGETHGRAGVDLIFDDDAIYEVRRFERDRRHHGVDRWTLRLLVGLRREVERLRTEVRFLRGP